MLTWQLTQTLCIHMSPKKIKKFTRGNKMKDWGSQKLGHNNENYYCRLGIVSWKELMGHKKEKWIGKKKKLTTWIGKLTNVQYILKCSNVVVKNVLLLTNAPH
jgi:hypothetical protein